MPIPSEPATAHMTIIAMIAPVSMKKNAATAPTWKAAIAITVIKLRVPPEALRP
jgi:hypothetical protein